ncbi:MAG: tRNA dihydrouridine synthase DusB [Firmicutes bacterium]|jgi:tRNA-dihydrouridine synthase B|nr:tRNA dihydrouridine synthase DusB [Bacillota bacterium]
MGVFLAPMAGVTDLPFRKLAREYGADLVVSEMISTQALVFKNQRTLNMLTIDPQERPVAIQLFGHKPEVMAEGARIAVEQCQPEMIDLNFGCPTPKIVKNGDGAALLRTPELLTRVADAVVRAVEIPVTAKIRLGWDEGSINCVEIAQRLQDVGVHWITIHARTRSQFYSGKANWDWIRKVKTNVRIPVVGNGDVFSIEDAQAMFEYTDCDHIAIGRGAQGNPWIFSQIKAWQERGERISPPSYSERIALALRHLRLKIDYDGVDKGIKEMRPHLAWYLKGIPHSAKVRGKLNTAESYEEVEKLLQTIL